MKLAILGTRGIPARYGGFETFAEELSVRLVRRGIDVTVYCEAGKEEQPGTFRGVQLVYIPSVPLGPLSTILFDLRCLWHSRNRYHLVYMLGYGSGIFCFIPRLWGSKVWINMDGIEWARTKWNSVAKLWLKIMERAAVRTCDGLIADAFGILQHLRSRHRHMPPCSVIPYGASVVDNDPPTESLRDWGLSPGNYYLVVCRLEPENSVREIIEGYLCSGSLIPLVVVGDIARSDPYTKGLMRLNDGRVRFVGTVYDKPRLQALRYYARAYFHGHTVGGTNPSLLEALGCGNIVIARDNVFNREVAGNAALYFDTVDHIPEIITRIQKLSIEERAERQRTARDRIAGNYSWESITARYEHLFSGEIKQKVPVPAGLSNE